MLMGLDRACARFCGRWVLSVCSFYQTVKRLTGQCQHPPWLQLCLFLAEHFLAKVAGYCAAEIDFWSESSERTFLACQKLLQLPWADENHGQADVYGT